MKQLISRFSLLLFFIFCGFTLPAQNENNESAIMLGYSRLAENYLSINPDTAKLYLDSASVYEKEVSDLNTLAIYYEMYGTYYDECLNRKMEAFEYIYKAIDCYEKTGDKQFEIARLFHNSMAAYYNYIRDVESLRKVADKVSILLKNTNTADSSFVHIIRNIIQNRRYYILYYDSDNHQYIDSIISTSKETIQIYRNSEKTDQENLYACMITTYNQLLLAEIGNTDLNEAEVTEYIKQFESIIEEDDFTGLGMVSQNKAEFLLRKGDYDAAEKEALKGLDLTDKQPEYERDFMLRNSYEMLRAIYEAKHNYKKALEYETKANVLTREKDHSEQYQVIKDLESKYDFEKKEQEIQFLDERNKTQAYIQWLFVGISVLLLIIFFLFSRRTRTRRKILVYQVEQLRYRTVQSKFIPHFTGNVLNSINYLISKNPDSAQKYIADFGIFSNRTLFNAEKLYQTLQEELEYMEAYLVLEKLRFEEKLNYSIHIDPAINTQILIPIMVLQTFCNNALKHGLWPKPGGGTIQIEGYLKEDYIVLAVEDNGIGREKAKALKTGGTGEGLKIVEQQLEFYNKEKTKKKNAHKAYFNIIDLYDSDHIPSGTRVELFIPQE